MTASRLRPILAVLLVVSGMAFAVGSAVERSSRNEVAQPSTAPTGHGEGGTEGSVEEPTGTEPAVDTETSENSETLLGINPESTALVVAGVVLSLLLAAGVWYRGSRPVLIAALVFGIAFAALDIREAIHQAGGSRTGLMTIAMALTVLHGAVAAISGLALRTQEAAPALA